MHKYISFGWHYSKANHEKSIWTILGRGGIEKMVFKSAMSSDIVIDDVKDFATFVNKIVQIESLYLASETVLKKPEEVKNAAPIPETLKVHVVVCERNKYGVFCNNIFTLARK